MKIVGYSLLGLVLVVVLAIVAVVILVDPNDFKDEIAQVVKKHTGRELKLEGELGLSIFPWLALEVRKAELGNAPGFGAEPFAAIEEADVGVKLWPLLHKELQIGKVRLQGLRVNLEVDEQGKSNWEDLGQGEETEQPAEGGAGQASIAGLIIKDSALSYEDRQAGSRIQISDLNLQTGRLAPGEPAEVKLSCKYSSGGDTPALPIELAIPALQLDLDKQTLQAPEFTLAVAPAKIRGQLAGEKILDSPAFSGRIALEQVSPRELFKTLGIDPPQTGDQKALTSLALEAAVAATTDNLNLSDLKLRLDDTQMTGTLGIADFATTALRFDLKVDKMDLDRYLPPEPPEPPPGTPNEPIELPVEMLKTLDAQGTLDVGALKLAGMQLTDVKLKVDAKNGVVRIDPSEAKLFSGTHHGKFTIDASGTTAKVAMEETLSGIDFAPLMQDLFESKRMSGKGSAKLMLAARGNDSAAWMKTLDGKADFSVADGAVQGMDLWYEIRRAESLLKQQAAPAGAGSGRTAFKTLKGSATVTDGTVDNRDLAVDMDYLKVAGQGTLELPTQAVDYQLKTTVYRLPEEGTDAQLQDLKSIEIPVRISGTFDDLKVRPDLEAKVKAEAKKKLDEKKEELKDKLEDKLGKWLKKR